jgi:GNAT superfamily N-acetyltransferase
MTTPEIVLDPMTEDEFVAWRTPSVQSYAQMHIEAGTWTAEEGLSLAEKEFGQLLPDGLGTAGHFLYTARDADGGESVGALWIQIRPKAGKQVAFVYDIAVDEDKRGSGYGRATMLACARRAREFGAQSVASRARAEHGGPVALHVPRFHRDECHDVADAG